MKKSMIYLMAISLSLTFFPVITSAANNNKARPVESRKPVQPSDSAEANTLVLRLNEIKTIDKSSLNAAEKKSLRKEVKATEKKLNSLGGGVYLSVGAAILIIVLLIVLL